MSENILEVTDLNMHYETISGNVAAVKEISFHVKKGESFGLVGESGCGKTSVAMSLVQLQADNAKISSGSIKLDGQELVGMSESELRSIRWDGISIVFQGAMNAWNPVIKIGEQIREAIREHYPNNTKTQNIEKIQELFEMVGLEASVIDRFPHELSGGMKQRAVIALALSCNPKLVIADEPTTALDVTVEAAVVDLVKDLGKKYGTSMLFISHNLGLVLETCDRICVMYSGEAVETGSIKDVFNQMQHPYTQALFRSIPLPGADKNARPLIAIPGNFPLPHERPEGCNFGPRCTYFEPNRCDSQIIEMAEIEKTDRHATRCLKL